MPLVHVKLWEHPVDLPEEEIEELRRMGLIRDDVPEPPPAPKPPAVPPGDKAKEQA